MLFALRKSMRLRWKVLKITFYTLFYNSHLSSDYVFDTLIQPAFWCVDNFTAVLGPIFVFLVTVLTLSVIFITYWVGLPYYLTHKSIYQTYSLIAIGHYLLANIVFHYWMALTTHPGLPPSNTVLTEVVSVCKKCIAPKPPRTHHCSVCNTCILKMDHHCPWLNNCVGHRNHRHFFLYMVFMVVGCLYLMVFGFEIVWDEVIGRWQSDEVLVEAELGEEEMEREVEREEERLASSSAEDEGGFYKFSRRSLVIYNTFMSTACFLCLGALTLWHAKFIHQGQTSIEAHINAAETKRLAEVGQKYVNPYNFGPTHNWHLFLGLIDGRGWMSVLLPSSHPPKGDGLSWDTVRCCDIKWTYRH